MKKQKRILTFVLLIALTSMFFVINADAASASIWFTDPTVTVGSNVSIVVDVKGSDIGGYEANISYDTTYLQFVSARGSSGNFSHVSNTGVIRLVDYVSSGSASKLSCTLTFKTKKTGTTKLTPSGCVFTSSGGDEIAPNAIGDSTVNIIPVPEASSDATLKELTVSNCTLSPAFSANVKEYTTNVDFAITSVTVSAIKNHKGASVYVSGAESLGVGENTVTITVTAENGAKNTYTIKVTRGKNPLSSDVFLTVGEGISAEVSNTITEDKVPSGFELTQITVNNVTVNAVIYDERAYPAIYLLGNENVTEGLYYIDTTNMTAKPFEYVGQPTNSLLMLDINMADVPEDYEIGKYTVDGAERDALIPKRAEAPNHCLVYAIGSSGQKQLYMYDPVENTFQRYSFAEMGEPETNIPEENEEETAPEKEPNEEETKKQDKDKKTDIFFGNSPFKWVFLGLGILVIVLCVVAIVIMIKER